APPDSGRPLELARVGFGRGAATLGPRRAHSSSGLGHRPLTAAARVRIPYAPLHRWFDQVTTSIEIEASGPVPSLGDVRIDRAEDPVDIAIAVEADLHFVAPVFALDEFGLEAAQALEHGACSLKTRRPDGQCLQVAQLRPPFG